MSFPKFYPGAPNSPASALNSPGNPSCTPPNPGSAGTETYVPGPPRGQTQLQVLSSPRAPCGGASGGGGRHLFCGTPGGTSSQRARRTPSPHPLPPPACATRRTGQIQRPLVGLQGVLGLVPPAPFLASRIPHPPHTSTLQMGKPGRTAWRRGRGVL